MKKELNKKQTNNKKMWGVLGFTFGIGSLVFVAVAILLFLPSIEDFIGAFKSSSWSSTESAQAFLWGIYSALITPMALAFAGFGVSIPAIVFTVKAKKSDNTANKHLRRLGKTFAIIALVVGILVAIMCLYLRIYLNQIIPTIK